MRPRERPPVLAHVAVALTVVVLAVTTVAPHPTVAGLLGLAVVAVCLDALARVTWSGGFAPVSVTFWAFVAVWVGFAPLLQIRDGRLPWPDLPLDQHYVTAQVVVLFAVLAHRVGHALAPQPVAPAGGGRREITVEKAVVVTGGALLLAAWSLPQTGGLLVRFADRDALQEAIADAGLRSGRDLALLGLLSTLPAAAAVVGLLLCLICWRERAWAHLGGRRVLAGTTTVAVLLNVVYNNPLSANRFASFSVLLAAGLALVRIDRQRWRTAFSAAMLLGIAVVYPLANSFRNERYRTHVRFGADAYYTFDFDGFQQTVNTAYYVDSHGYTWGHHLLSALLFWVPRSMWEGKAVGAGNVVAASRGYEFQNLSMPFWAEVFLEFGLVGVLVVGYLSGRLARRLDHVLNAPAAGLATTAAVLFAACQIGLLRGPLGAQIPFAGAAFVLLLVGVAGWHGRPWGLTRRAPAPPEVTGRPRVAVLADWWWPDQVGGAERSARAVANGLARFADVAVFVPAAVEHTYRDGPITVHAVHRPFARTRPAGSVLRHGFEFLTAWTLPAVAARIARRVTDFGPDVVVGHNLSRTGPWLLRRVRRTRFVRVFHDLSDTCWRRSRVKDGNGCAGTCHECTVKVALMRRATPLGAGAVCVSGFVRDELVRADVVSTATVGYPLVATGSEVRAAIRPNRGELVVGYLGRISPVKGVDDAIRTAAAFGRATGRPVELVVAGSGPPAYLKSLRQLASAGSVPVAFPGPLDVDEFCARVDVVLVPSVWPEAFGRVAVEVGARGRPMLISPTGGLPEAAAVSGGRYAFADFRDPAAAAAALVDLLAGAGPEEPPPAADPVTLPAAVAAEVLRRLGTTRADGVPRHAARVG